MGQLILDCQPSRYIMLADQATRGVAASAVQKEMLVLDLELDVIIAFVLDDTTGGQANNSTTWAAPFS